MAALRSHGRLRWDLGPLTERVQALPLTAWEYRSDPESKTTRVIRPGMAAWREVEDLVRDTLAAIETQCFQPGYFNRLVLSCVPAGEAILPHTDDFGDAIRRISLHGHLSLMTDPSIVMGFSQTGREVHLEAGHVYTLDETQAHYVKNPSGVDRIHLLFAYFPHSRDLSPYRGAVVGNPAHALVKASTWDGAMTLLAQGDETP